MKQVNRGKQPSLTRREVLDIRRRDAQGNYIAPVGFYSRLHGLSYEHVRKIRRGEVYAWVTEGLEGVAQEDENISREIVREIEEQIIGAPAEEAKPLSPEILASFGKVAKQLEDKPPPAVPYLQDPAERLKLESGDADREKLMQLPDQPPEEEKDGQ